MIRFAIVPVLFLGLTVSNARAEDAAVTCVTGQFADHVEQGKPVGDAASIAAAKKAVYWVDMGNTGDATQVTLVWKVDGKEVQRQTLDVGHSPHWHTWGGRPLGGAKAVEVQVQDSAGATLKEDSLSL